jgi:hypothetical protein
MLFQSSIWVEFKSKDYKWKVWNELTWERVTNRDCFKTEILRTA